MVNASIQNTLYDKLPNLVLGFHGCRKSTYERVLHEHEHLRKSENSYDWLGNGIYFWENSYERALEWAKNKYKDDFAVVGAVLDLGHCLNLTDYKSTQILKLGYEFIERLYQRAGRTLPENLHGRSDTDLLLRNLDCLVIQQIHKLAETNPMVWSPFDSVRGVFVEGKEAFPGSAIAEKTHIQICIVNPNCIKGYFAPIEPEKEFPIP